MSTAARCRGCRERIDATHRPGCPEGTGAVLVAHTDNADALEARAQARQDPGPEPGKPPLEADPAHGQAPVDIAPGDPATLF